jgi:LAO/AO transport system kinase
MQRAHDVGSLAAAVRSGDRGAIARAITLVESRLPEHRTQAQELLTTLLPHSPGGYASTAGGTPIGAPTTRVGISGVPGVGKSTFIDQLGLNLIADGHRVAVLAVDPSSVRTKGSILGDRTRMARLASHDDAFVRPSPTAGTLGGVAAATREAMLVLEAARYDVVLVETVGVGQSEYAVADMVDTFVFLTLARTGDQLQGIKRGILELADVVAVNKSDEQQESAAARAARELSAALRFLRGDAEAWQPPVVTCSGLHNVNLDQVWRHVQRHRAWVETQTGLEAKRRAQLVAWTRSLARDRLLARLDTPAAREAAASAEAAVLAGELTPDAAADQILATLDRVP